MRLQLPSISTSFILLLIIDLSLVEACLEFRGHYNKETRYFELDVLDNNKGQCFYHAYIPDTGNAVQYFNTFIACVPGKSAWFSKKGSTYQAFIIRDGLIFTPRMRTERAGLCCEYTVGEVACGPGERNPPKMARRTLEIGMRKTG